MHNGDIQLVLHNHRTTVTGSYGIILLFAALQGKGHSDNCVALFVCSTCICVWVVGLCVQGLGGQMIGETLHLLNKTHLRTIQVAQCHHGPWSINSASRS